MICKYDKEALLETREALESNDSYCVPSGALGRPFELYDKEALLDTREVLESNDNYCVPSGALGSPFEL